MESADFKNAGFKNFRVCACVEAAVGIPKTQIQSLQLLQSDCKAAAKLPPFSYPRHILYPLSQVLNRFCTQERNFILFSKNLPLVFYARAVIIVVDSKRRAVKAARKLKWHQMCYYVFYIALEARKDKIVLRNIFCFRDLESSAGIWTDDLCEKA